MGPATMRGVADFGNTGILAAFLSVILEDLNEFTDSLGDVQKQFQELAAGNTEEAKIIDEAIKEIDKVTEFVKEQIENNETDDAIKALEFIEKYLSDV